MKQVTKTSDDEYLRFVFDLIVAVSLQLIFTVINMFLESLHVQERKHLLEHFCNSPSQMM